MKRIVVVASLLAAPVLAQNPAPPAGARTGGRAVVITDTARARALFVSKAPADLAGCGAQCDAQVKARKATDSTYEARAKGVMDFRIVNFKSRVDGLDIPAYLFAPLTKKPAKHAALVWVHGGVHSHWGSDMWPFVRDAIDRGYVVITPNYRGSTGYGDEKEEGAHAGPQLFLIDYLGSMVKVRVSLVFQATVRAKCV